MSFNSIQNNTLATTYEDVMLKLGQAVDEFPWENLHAYSMWLSQTYYYVRHSTRLIALSSASIGLENQDFHWRLNAHLDEEKGHEKMCLNDLKHLSRELGPEVVPTSAFYQCQYYWITRQDPLAFWGYVLMLEGLAAKHGPRLGERLREAYGAKGISFVKVHAEEDQDHIVKAIEYAQKMKPDVQALVIQNMEQSAQLYSLMLTELSQYSGLNQKFQAA